jgi:hypothetical protein
MAWREVWREFMRDPVRGATRIYAEATPTAADFAPGSPKPKAPDSYLTTLLKLIPSEIVAGYVAVGQMWQSKGYLLVWFWLCMVACFLFRAYASLPKDQPGGPKQVQWVAVLITCVAFYLWASTVYSPGDAKGAPSALNIIPDGWGRIALEPWQAGGIGLLFSILAAVFVPKDPQKP